LEKNKVLLSFVILVLVLISTYALYVLIMPNVEKYVRVKDAEHYIVYYDPGKWAAVPANNGHNGPYWQWGEEILVGFTVGTFKNRSSGHQVDNEQPLESWLARSTDGGKTWAAWKPDNYAGLPYKDVPSHPGNIDFTQEGFVMRVEGTGYHGNKGPWWFYSMDKGETWQGPFAFTGLMSHPELEGMELTSRTAYIVNGPHELYLFMSARPKSQEGTDKVFLAKTVDGGRTFSFVSWIVPPSDPYRAVMPAPVRLSESKIVVAIRRRSTANNWIDCYVSYDNGMTWSFLSKVDDIGGFNGNPPALIRLKDGRLVCVYGNRSDKCIIAKYSEDEGKTWSIGYIIRDDFQSVNGWPDLGYPRLFQRPDGRLVAVYFWCTKSRPQTHIEATVFSI